MQRNHLKLTFTGIHAYGVSKAQKDTVVVSDHCDTENDSKRGCNRFSAELYLVESY